MQVRTPSTFINLAMDLKGKGQARELNEDCECEQRNYESENSEANSDQYDGKYWGLIDEESEEIMKVESRSSSYHQATIKHGILIGSESKGRG